MNYRFTHNMAWQRWWISWGLGVLVMTAWVGLELSRWAAFQPDDNVTAVQMRPVVQSVAQPVMQKAGAKHLGGYVRI